MKMNLERKIKMNELQIFKNEKFGEISCNFYKNENNDIFMTREQIGEALEYANPNDAIRLIHRRNKERLDKFSASFKLNATDGKQYDTMVYSARGIYEICRFSKQPKANEFYDWVYDVIENIRKTGSYSVQQEITEYQKKELEVKEKEANAQLARLWMQLGDRAAIPEYRQITDSYASQVLAGKRVLPLPKMEKQTYSATEIGEKLGISRNRVGNLAKKYNLKTEEYGKWFYDKSPYSNKEVETFRYFDTIVPKLQELL